MSVRIFCHRDRRDKNKLKDLSKTLLCNLTQNQYPPPFKTHFFKETNEKNGIMDSSSYWCMRVIKPFWTTMKGLSYGFSSSSSICNLFKLLCRKLFLLCFDLFLILPHSTSVNIYSMCSVYEISILYWSNSDSKYCDVWSSFDHMVSIPCWTPRHRALIPRVFYKERFLVKDPRYPGGKSSSNNSTYSLSFQVWKIKT